MADPTQLKVYDDSGMEVVRPDVVMFVMQAVIAAHTARTRKLAEDRRAEGISESIIITATDRVNHWAPRKPIKSFTAVNKGTGRVYISTNVWEVPSTETVPLEKDEIREQNAEGHTIEQIYYSCPSGETAELRIIGQR